MPSAIASSTAPTGSPRRSLPTQAEGSRRRADHDEGLNVDASTPSLRPKRYATTKPDPKRDVASVRSRCTETPDRDARKGLAFGGLSGHVHADCFDGGEPLGDVFSCSAARASRGGVRISARTLANRTDFQEHEAMRLVPPTGKPCRTPHSPVAGRLRGAPHRRPHEPSGMWQLVDLVE